MTTRFAHHIPASPQIAWLLVLLLALAFMFAGDQQSAGTAYPSVISPAEVFL